MTALPAVSVITPTWQRHDPLLKRCIPSVRVQDYEGLIEHVIVSDGPDEMLPRLLELGTGEWTEAGSPDGETGAVIRAQADGSTRITRSLELPEHDPALHWGTPARRLGTSLAKGDLIAYLDDDDAYRPEHVRVMAGALIAAPDAMFAVGRMLSHQPAGDSVIGDGPLGFGNVGTPMIIHRRELLELAGWDVSSPGEDWEIVSRWLGAGARYVRVDAETVDVWPSAFWHGQL